MQKLIDILKRENIFIKYDHVIYKDRELYGLYFYERLRDAPIILLDHSLEHNYALHRSVLAEEIGHYFTVPKTQFTKPYACYKDRLSLSHDEWRAKSWAAEFLISNEALHKALLQNLNSLDELAEYLNVTNELVYVRLELWKRKGHCLM